MNIKRGIRLAAMTMTGLLIVGALTSRPFCTPARAADQNPEILNNAAIIEMQQLNLGEGVILDKIRTSKCDFDVTLPGLKQLKEAKISDPVIQAMIGAAAPATPTPPPLTPPPMDTPVIPVAAGDPNDPMVQHEPGVWLYAETNGVKTMTPLDAESYRIWMGGGPFGSARRAVLSGLDSKTVVSTPRPVFYLYFGEGRRNNIGMIGTTTPDQLPLAKLELKAKTQERLLVIGSVSPFAGYNSGIPTKFQVAYDSEKIAPGIYKATPGKDLAEGEYAFCFFLSEGLEASPGRMFSFEVRK